MPVHPSSRSFAARAAAIAVLIAAAAGLWILLAVYGGFTTGGALADSIVFTVALAAAGYAYWFAGQYIIGAAAKAVTTAIVLLIALALTFAVTTLLGICLPARFARTIPLHTIYGAMLWLMLSAWYAARRDPVEAPAPELPPPAEAETLDRITVKDGPKIEIIAVESLFYIQAYGDYVMLHTEKGRFVKEQTMKYYEGALPANFVRIHRSFIVNADRIARVELSGKENYTVKLKNGVGIRASAPGYKLLRQRLSL